jgi:hypothetical protein
LHGFALRANIKIKEKEVRLALGQFLYLLEGMAQKLN